MVATLKILVVDDNPQILRLICGSLDKCGELITAKDGGDALQKALAVKPDLIISDYSMPVMDGLALLEKLRAHPETQKIPVVLLATRKEVDERLRMVVEGVEDFLIKPFLVRDLERQVRRITARLLQKKMEDEGGRGRISGRLAEISVIDWMQSLEQGRKTCTLFLSHDQETCAVYFNEGDITHAVSGDLVGDQAVFRALTWMDGDWEVDFQKNSPEHTTSMSTQGLVMEGLRLLDEANRDAGSV